MGAQFFFVLLRRADGQDRRGNARAVEGLRDERVRSGTALLVFREQEGIGHKAALHRSLVRQRLEAAQNLSQPLGHVIFELPIAVDVDAGHQAGTHAAR